MGDSTKDKLRAPGMALEGALCLWEWTNLSRLNPKHKGKFCLKKFFHCDVSMT